MVHVWMDGYWAVSFSAAANSHARNPGLSLFVRLLCWGRLAATRAT